MEAKAKSFTFLGNEGKVKIPFFQRGYVWKKENWSDLLDDLKNTEKSHFLGSLILKQQPAWAGEIKEVLVIDGQQRLTTLSILVKVLFDLFSDDLKQTTKPLVQSYLFYKKTPTDKNFFLKIQHSHMNTVAFKEVIEDSGIRDRLGGINEKSSLILQCYKFFYEQLSQFAEEKREALFNSMLNPENKILVVIDLEPNDNEQAIFDTINSAGVRLSAADIIKNALFQRALQLFDDQDDVVDFYTKTWNATFLQDEETTSFWDAARITGRLMRDNIEILLHSVGVIDGFYKPEDNRLEDLGPIYKKRIENYATRDEVEDFINEICAYAKLYRENIASFSNSSLLGFDDYTSRLLHILDVLQVTTFHPFILYVLKNHEDERKRAAIFKKLEVFLIRRMIVGAETKSYNKVCVEFINNLAELDAKSVEITDDRVVWSLKRIDNKPATLLLFWVELRRRAGDNRYDTKELKYNYSLEHIMPQKWEQFWTDIPAKTKTSGEAMSPEESIQDRGEKVCWIGNMTLLTTSLNSSLRNFVFTKKMEGEGRKKGVKSYASLSITKDDIVVPFEQGDRVWDESKIATRTIQLTTEILALW